jgi:hypothetical protein
MHNPNYYFSGVASKVQHNQQKQLLPLSHKGLQCSSITRP